MILMGIIFVLTFVIGIPVGFCLGVSGIIGLLTSTTASINVAAVRMYTSLDSFALIAIPLYIIMGFLMEKAGALSRLLKFLQLILGSIKGGMAYLNVINSMLFAGISGSAVADASSLGYLEIKLMEETGIPRDFSGALTAASAVIGPIIPPSLAMVVYALAIGSRGGVSIGGLFVAGIIPGILLGISLIIYSFFYIHKKGISEHITKQPRASGKEILLGTWKALPILFLPVVVVGGILGGVFTVTEAAAVGILYTIIFGFFVSKELKLHDIPLIMVKAAATTGTVILVFGASSLVSWMFTINGIPGKVASVITNFTNNPQVFMLLTVFVLFLVGCIMEQNAAIVMLAPILYPIAVTLGIPAYQYGLVFVLCIEMGLLTPPIGILLFITSSVGSIPLDQLIKKVWPLFAMETVVVLLMVFIPQITTGLPQLFNY